MSFTLVPYSDIIKLLQQYGQAVNEDKNKNYERVWNLIIKGSIVTSSEAIVDYIIAYNLSLQGFISPIYKTSTILLSEDLKPLIKILGTSDKSRIIRILSYLNVLDNDMSIFDTLPDDAL